MDCFPPLIRVTGLKFNELVTQRTKGEIGPRGDEGYGVRVLAKLGHNSHNVSEACIAHFNAVPHGQTLGKERRSRSILYSHRRHFLCCFLAEISSCIVQIDE